MGCGNYTLIDFVGVIGKMNGENASHWCLSSLCMHAMRHHVCKMKINEAVMAHMCNGVQQCTRVKTIASQLCTMKQVTGAWATTNKKAHQAREPRRPHDVWGVTN